MDYIREYKSFINSHYLNGAVRITIGITLPAILLGFFNNLSAGIVLSIGAMCVGNTDNPGPIHHRRNGMIACVIIIFLVTLLTGIVSWSPVLTGVLVFFCCFIFSMMGIYGNRASSIGVNALLVMVLNIDRPQEGWHILINAAYVLAGGTWYTILSLLLYSFRPYKLTQQALGECVQATADYLAIKASFYDPGVDYDRSYRRLVEQQVAVHEKQELIRELLFKSRAVVKESTDTGRVLVMMFLDIVDLFERVMTSHQDYRMLHECFDDSGIMEQYGQVIRTMALELDEIGIAIKSGRPSVETSLLADRIKALREYFNHYRDEKRTARNVEGFIGLRHILDSIEDIADRLHTLHGYTTYDRKLGKSFTEEQLDYEQFVTHQDIDGKLLVDNLSLQSNIFRHSLRVAIATIAGYLISRLLPFGHGYWILLTITVILKPAYSLTKKRNYERLVGTLAGALVGFVLLWFIKDRSVLFFLMILFMVGTYVFLRTNYLVCVTLMTPYVLLLFHLLYPNDFHAILSDRVIDTAIGSAIAFVANIFLVPSWEHERIKDFMLRIIEDNAAYFRDISGAFLGLPATLHDYKLSRKNAFVALANLSDAFNRMLTEPRSKQTHTDRMHEFVVSNHMLTSHIATLSYYVLPAPDAPPGPEASSALIASPALNASPTSAPDALPTPNASPPPPPAAAPAKYADAAYKPVIEAILLRLEMAADLLQEGPGYTVPAASSATRKDELRAMNDRVNTLVSQRKAELDLGIVQSDTRRKLSELKPVVDQFNFIAKVSGDIERLSRDLRSEIG